jgi:Holliday junction resolvasome RuvABC ATP-dependent DNA helicase subunit
MTDIELLKKAEAWEARNTPRAWQALDIGATRQDINRLLDSGYFQRRAASSRIGPGQFGPALYKLTDKGLQILEAKKDMAPVTVEALMRAMQHIVGFEKLKLLIAETIANHKRAHFLLEGPPASVKSTILDAIRNVVPDSTMVFGRGASAKGLSNKLFEEQPSVLLMDELDKSKKEVREMILGLMETGEILNTKADDSRGIVLDTLVFAACNSSNMFAPEFKSRFAMHPCFQRYTRNEFIEVVISMLVKDTPAELAEYIAVQVFDSELGDVRQARDIRKLMNSPTITEAERILNIKLEYRPKEAVLASAKRKLF